MNGDKGKMMSKLLARQAQKKLKKDEEEQRAKEAEAGLESDSVEGSESGSVADLASIATSVRSFANDRGTLMPSSRSGNALLNSRGTVSDNQRMSMEKNRDTYRKRTD